MPHEPALAHAATTLRAHEGRPDGPPQACKTWVVTRHQGAMAWLRDRGWEAEMVTHFDVAVVQPGDRVIGTLPLHLAAEVCERGGRYVHLSMEVPAQWRGEELTPQQMERCGARLEAFSVWRLPDDAGPVREAGASPAARAVLP